MSYIGNSVQLLTAAESLTCFELLVRNIFSYGSRLVRNIWKKMHMNDIYSGFTLIGFDDWPICFAASSISSGTDQITGHHRVMVQFFLEIAAANVNLLSWSATSQTTCFFYDITTWRVNGANSRYGFIVGEFPSPGPTAGRTDRRLVQWCIVSDLVGEEERLSSGEKTPIRAFLTWWKH